MDKECFDYEEYIDSLSSKERKEIQDRLSFLCIIIMLIDVIIFAIGFGFLLWIVDII